MEIGMDLDGATDGNVEKMRNLWKFQTFKKGSFSRWCWWFVARIIQNSCKQIIFDFSEIVTSTFLSVVQSESFFARGPKLFGNLIFPYNFVPSSIHPDTALSMKESSYSKHSSENVY